MEESISKLTEDISETTVGLEDGLKNINLSNPLEKAKSDKRVEWSSDTIDNEHLGHHSSECCCVHEKPSAFDESSSESENDDDNCDILCACGQHKGRCCVLLSTVATTSPSKIKIILNPFMLKSISLLALETLPIASL
ncbi:E3 ubiquitin-protein ligase PPP1R11-like [Phodopus roborovskii]|uniref:E3 ubiquitin-protein ligase PPP1R11-like n=1 Tax=Phodopus roborovskii TaxID=109678 RepID=UPI0021E3CF01|nr:E3 ubiquitin-protein ligase PPP1R11-like [Phodopus roborovskii]